ncbi:hypothetical protein E2C01_067050 [Portunus trituberculatus]|uniref:Uncharacterized protein n=1 Tax=Portunus trituberculatus TaxID=210409 RepID=A0A5B7HVJ2_PORTR|nr:hypothetical protein [Portunus trituberculatus]
MRAQAGPLHHTDPGAPHMNHRHVIVDARVEDLVYLDRGCTVANQWVIRNDETIHGNATSHAQCLRHGRRASHFSGERKFFKGGGVTLALFRQLSSSTF